MWTSSFPTFSTVERFVRKIPFTSTTMTTKVTLRRRQNLPKSSSVYPAMMKPGDVKSRNEKSLYTKDFESRGQPFLSSFSLNNKRNLIFILLKHLGTPKVTRPLSKNLFPVNKKRRRSQLKTGLRFHVCLDLF